MLGFLMLTAVIPGTVPTFKHAGSVSAVGSAPWVLPYPWADPVEVLSSPGPPGPSRANSVVLVSLFVSLLPLHCHSRTPTEPTLPCSSSVPWGQMLNAQQRPATPLQGAFPGAVPVVSPGSSFLLSALTVFASCPAYHDDWVPAPQFRVSPRALSL